MKETPKFFDDGLIYGAVVFRKRLCKGWFITDRVRDNEKGNSCFEDFKAVRGLKGVGLDMVIV